MGVFTGGCTIESAEAVCNAGHDLPIHVLEGISSLVDNNLLQRNETASEEVRFTMLQTIREYALEELASRGEIDFTRRAHAAYAIVLAEEGAAQIREEDRVNWLAAWDAEHDNLRQAVDWLIAAGNGAWALRLGTALFAFWERREHLAEGRERLEAILKLTAEAPPSRERARAAWYAGIFAEQQGDFEAAVRLNREALQVYREVGDPKGTAVQLANVGHTLAAAGRAGEAQPFFEESLAACKELGDPAAIAGAQSNFAAFARGQGQLTWARSLLEEALASFRKLGDNSAVGWSLSHLGDIAFDEGNLEDACRLYEQTYELFRSIGERWGMARSLADLGRAAAEKDDLSGARSLLEQALKLFADLSYTRGIAKLLEEFACLAVREAKLEEALVLCASAEALRQKVGMPMRPNERAKLADAVDTAWRGVDAQTAAAAWSAGMRMTAEEAVECALNGSTVRHESSARN
jgi:tetratricopeptide (TPR) repeat protein